MNVCGTSWASEGSYTGGRQRTVMAQRRVVVTTVRASHRAKDGEDKALASPPSVHAVVTMHSPRTKT